MEAPPNFTDLRAPRIQTDPSQAQTDVHDPAYKECFSFPRMIDELVRSLASRWVVVYGGHRSWHVPTSLADLLPPTPSELLVNQPLYEYVLLEERRGGTEGLPPGNLVTALVGVLRARTKTDLVAQLAQLHDWLGSDRDGPSIGRSRHGQGVC